MGDQHSEPPAADPPRPRLVTERKRGAGDPHFSAGRGSRGVVRPAAGSALPAVDAAGNGRPGRVGGAFQSSPPVIDGLQFPIVDDLSLIAADDELLDAIAGGRPATNERFRGSLEPLLESWRSEITEPPLPALPAMVVALPRQPASVSAPSRRALRPMIAVVAAICALVLGSASVGAQSARPGDALWPLTRVLYADHAHSVVAAQAVSRSLKSARVALGSGDAGRAIVALTAASRDVEKVAVVDGRKDLQATLDNLWGQATDAEPAGSARRFTSVPAASVAASSGRNEAVRPAGSGAAGSVIRSASRTSKAAPDSRRPTTTSKPARSSSSQPRIRPAPVVTTTTVTVTKAPASGTGTAIGTTDAPSPTDPVTTTGSQVAADTAAPDPSAPFTPSDPSQSSTDADATPSSASTTSELPAPPSSPIETTAATQKPTQHEPTQQKPTQHEPTQQKPTQQEPNQQKPTQQEPNQTPQQADAGSNAQPTADPQQAAGPQAADPQQAADPHQAADPAAGSTTPAQ